jgi:DNA-binding CsgD family transcriptional regulator
METARRHGKLYKGHTIPYGTFAGASQALISAYYGYGYLRDEDIPELPCPLFEYVECHSPEEELFKKQMAEIVGEMLDTVTPREKKVLCLRFGIGLTYDYTLEEIAVNFDLTKERIRQIEAKAIRKMRNPSRVEILRGLFGTVFTDTEKEAELKTLQEQWQRARKRAREIDEADKRAEIRRIQYEQERKQEREQERERVHQEDLRLRAKWEEIKPMVSNIELIAHLKIVNPKM